MEGCQLGKFPRFPEKKKQQKTEIFFVALVYNECVCVNAHQIKTKSLALTRDIIIIRLDLSN